MGRLMTVAEHMEIWRKKEPWLYSELVFNKYTYYLIMTAVVCLISSSLIIYPIISNGFAALVGYFLAQFIFQMGHMTTHALYIEAPKEEWEPGVYVAYLHHYEAPKAIYEHSLVHRLNFLMQTKGSTVAYAAAWALPFFLFGSSILPLYFWYLFWFSMVEPVHEWYHVPEKKRKEHFTAPMYYGLRLLTKMKLLSEQDHIEHHKHSTKDMDKVTKFSDLYFPFADKVFDWLWGIALTARDRKIFKKNPIRKAIYAYGTLLVPSVFSVGSYLFLLGGHS